MFTSQGCHCGDTIRYFQISLTFNQNHVEASREMINNFPSAFKPPLPIHMYISFSVIADYNIQFEPMSNLFLSCCGLVEWIGLQMLIYV